MIDTSSLHRRALDTSKEIRTQSNTNSALTCPFCSEYYLEQLGSEKNIYILIRLCGWLLAFGSCLF